MSINKTWGPVRYTFQYPIPAILGFYLALIHGQTNGHTLNIESFTQIKREKGRDGKDRTEGREKKIVLI